MVVKIEMNANENNRAGMLFSKDRADSYQGTADRLIESVSLCIAILKELNTYLNSRTFLQKPD